MKYKTLTPAKSVLFALLFISCSLSYANINPRPAPAQASGARAGYETIMSQPISRSAADKEEEEKPQEVEQSVVKDAKTVHVRDVELTGNDLFDTATLKSLIIGDIKSDMSFAQIKKLATVIEEYYIKQGYLIVKVYIPKNALKDGVLTIAVLEGKLGKVNVSGNNRYSQKKIEDTVYSYLEKGKAFTIEEVESPLVLLGTYPALSVKSALSAGEELGTTDINVEVQESKMVSASLEFNNFGGESTGEYRIIPYIAFENPTGIGDQFSVFSVLSPDQFDSWTYQVAYSLPITDFGTSFAAYFGQGNNTVSGSGYDILDIEGSSLSWGAGFNHQFIWSAKTKLTLELMFDWLDVDSIANSLNYQFYEDGVRKVRIGGTFDNKDSTGRTIVSFYLHQGIGECLGATDNNSTTSSRAYANADNKFSKFVLGLVRVQSILPNLYGILNITGQYSTDPLVASEQIYLGGANSIRGQPYSTVAGDDGVVINFELRYSVLPSYPDIQLATFIDYGTSHTKTPTYDEDDWTILGGAGVGVRAQFLECIDMRFDVAVPVGTKYGDDVYFYGQIRYVF